MKEYSVLKIRWKKDKEGTIYCPKCGFAFFTPNNGEAFGTGWNRANPERYNVFPDWETGIINGLINFCPKCGLEMVKSEFIGEDVYVMVQSSGKIYDGEDSFEVAER